jgi:hypothetical protein
VSGLSFHIAAQHAYFALGNGGITFIIMSVESGVGVACGCLPGCKPFMNRMFPRIFASSSSQTSYTRQRIAQNPEKRVDTGSSSLQSYVESKLPDICMMNELR